MENNVNSEGEKIVKNRNLSGQGYSLRSTIKWEYGRQLHFWFAPFWSKRKQGKRDEEKNEAN